MNDFNGVKIGLIYEDKLVMIQRDDKPGLRFPGMWDFPGGARESSETPFECASRELSEELSIKLDPKSIVWKKEVESMHDPKLQAHFFVANISKEEIGKIKLGDEGQRWDLIPVDDFFKRSDVVPKLKDRLKSYLDSITQK